VLPAGEDELDLRLRVVAAWARSRRAGFRAERMLGESLARSDAILETAADGVITIDEHGIVTSFNAAAGRLFGYSSEQVIGRNVALLMPAPHRDRHDEYLRAYEAGGPPKIIGT